MKCRDARPRRRGFTLLEVAVATALTGVLMVMVLTWVGQLARSGALGGIQRQAERDATWVLTNLSRDAGAAGPCDTDNLRPTLAAMGKTTLSLHVDDDLDGVRDLVTWTVANGAVERAVFLAEAPCAFSADASSEVVITTMIDEATSEAFRPIGGGVVGVAPQSNAPANCMADRTACSLTANGTTATWTGVRISLIFENDKDVPLAKLDDAVSWGLD
jgi:prepilin-type N-terminal cleavage/methylation domain-containing protein